MKTDRHGISDTDRRIADMVRGEASPVPRDEWFVSKTLNRLPPRCERILGLPEIIAAGVVLVISGTVMAVEARHLLQLAESTSDSVADLNPLMLLAAAACALCAALYLAIPVLKNANP